MRLESMVLMAGTEMPLKIIRQYLGRAVHVVVQCQRGQDGGRRIVLATNRRVSFREASNNTRSMQYQFTLIEIHLDKNGGWAEVSISGPSALVGGHASLKKHSEHQHWGLIRRDRDSWELALPPDAVYLPRALAVRILAHQLAALADTGTAPAAPDDKRTQLARLLDVLLEQPPSH